MKHIKGDFSLNASVRSPRADLGGGTKAEFFFFRVWSCVHTTDPRIGSKSQTISFSESTHVANQIKGN